MQMKAGDRVGDYEVLGVLGAGGMGSVYKVRNVISDRVEAMKVLLPNLAEHQELKDRFLREIKTSASLEHTQIAGLRTAFQSGDMLLMVMEYVEGETLDAILRHGPLPINDAIRYTAQTLEALEYAHSRGVVHRDIKPANIMITPKGTAKLLDFGIAKASADKALTMAGTTMGSLFYMSPEQIRGEQVDARADLYSLGITLYELVTGKRPFGGDSGYAIMAEHLQKQPVPPVELDSRVPQALNNVILRALAKNANDRFASAAAFRHELVAAMDPAARTTPYDAQPTVPHVAAASAAPPSPAPPVVAAPPPTPTPAARMDAPPAAAFAPPSAVPPPSASPAMPASGAVPTAKKPSNTLALAMIAVILLLAIGGVVVVLAGSWFFGSSGTAVAKEDTGLLSGLGGLFSSKPSSEASATPEPEENRSAEDAVESDPLQTQDRPSLADPSNVGNDGDTVAPPAEPSGSLRADAQPVPTARSNSAQGQPRVTSPVAPSVARPSQPAPTERASAYATPNAAGSGYAQDAPRATASAPAMDAKAEAETRDLFSKLAIRAATVQESAKKLSEEQSAMGVSLRADIRASLKRMEYLMDQTEGALNKGDLSTARAQMGYAEREVEKLEKFFGL